MTATLAERCYTECCKKALYAEGRYAECHYAECRCALGSLQLDRPLIVLIHFPDFVDETMPNNPLYLTKTLAVSVWQSKITASWTNITSEPGMNTLKL